MVICHRTVEGSDSEGHGKEAVQAPVMASLSTVKAARDTSRKVPARDANSGVSVGAKLTTALPSGVGPVVPSSLTATSWMVSILYCSA